MRKGLHESEVEAALGDLDTADLPEPMVAALRLADLLTAERPKVDDAVYADLRRYFDADQILELGVALSIGSGWQRFIEAFGIRPDMWSEAHRFHGTATNPAFNEFSLKTPSNASHLGGG